MPDVVIHEVGPRDGLQIEKSIVPTAQKMEWIEKLIESRVDAIQLGSFVNPERVPQMKDTEELFVHFRSRKNAPAFSALVLNDKGLDRGLAVGVEYFCMGASASDTHSRKNSGAPTKEAVDRIVTMAQRAKSDGKRVQVSVQSAFGCGFEGHVPQQRVFDVIRRYHDAGLSEISLADTAGHANPRQVEEMFGVLADIAPGAALACHFHDTYGMALANCFAAWRAGVRTFESAAAGLGGCPFTALSGGNVATEDLVHMFQRMGVSCGVELAPLVEAAALAEEFLGRKLPGRIHSTGPIPAQAFMQLTT